MSTTIYCVNITDAPVAGLARNPPASHYRPSETLCGIDHEETLAKAYPIGGQGYRNFSVVYFRPSGRCIRAQGKLELRDSAECLNCGIHVASIAKAVKSY